MNPAQKFDKAVTISKGLVVTDISKLRVVSEPLKTRHGVKAVVEKIKEAMKHTWVDGVGLTAIQIGIPKRIAYLKFDDGQEVTLINPVITKFSGDLLLEKEGCLSIPDAWTPVVRNSEITVIVDGLNGKERVFTNFKARAIQHEIDLMDGILNIDKKAKLIKKRHTNTTPGEDRSNRYKKRRDKAKAQKKSRKKNRKK